MSEPRTVRVAIIGSGPAGYTAAIYAARALLQPVLISGIQPGGQLTITTDVENYPGFADVIQGPWLMDQMRAQAEHVGTDFIDDVVVSADLSSRPFRLTCDGFFYRGKTVAVVGGGNTAVEEALFLTSFASKVTLIHRRDELRAERILQERLFAHAKIEVVWDCEIDEVLGQDTPAGVTAIRLKNLKTGATSELAVDGLFIAIGHAPASELFQGQLAMDASGYLLVKPGTASTQVEGVYAAGDVCDAIYRQAVTAAGMGCMAALEAARFLAEEDHRRAHHPISHKEAEKIGVW